MTRGLTKTEACVVHTTQRQPIIYTSVLPKKGIRKVPPSKLWQGRKKAQRVSQKCQVAVEMPGDSVRQGEGERGSLCCCNVAECCTVGSGLVEIFREGYEIALPAMGREI